MARGQIYFDVNVPSRMSLVDKRLVGENIIRKIQTRTANHTDIDGDRFAPYSPGYRKEKQLLTGTGQPNLYLTGEMLNSLSILEIQDTRIRIGYQAGSFEARKSYWNQGGNPSIPNREFLGEQDSKIESEIRSVEEDSPITAALRFIERNTLDVEEFIQLNSDIDTSGLFDDGDL